MTAQLQARCLHQSRSVWVGDYRCRALSPERSAEELNTRHAVVLPRDGVFVRHVRGEAVVGDPTQAMFFEAGEPYRVSHPVGCGDRCTSIGLSDAALEELLARHDPGSLDRGGRVFRYTHATTAPAIDLRHRRVVRTLEDRASDALASDEAVAALLDGVFAAAYRPSGRARTRPDTDHAHRALAESARLVLAARFRGRVTLDEVARAVHSSPFHLARVFRTTTGMTLHRCLTRLRLRAALEQLAGNRDADLSRLALALGFYDQSHFANAFKAELGFSPSRWRAEATPGEARRMSKLLQD